MSQELINRSPDLKKLRNEGHEVEVRNSKLLVGSVPYFNQQLNVCYGTLVTPLDLAGDQTAKPGTHIMHFIGTHPCTKDGVEIESIRHAAGDQDLGDGIVVNRSFSNKPAAGYTDFYEKVTRYIEIISNPVRSKFPEISPKTFRPIESNEDQSVFRYLDTNSSRADIDRITAKLRSEKAAIIGGGGTGSYVLDLVSKTPVDEIHIFDGDTFLQHNAFRSPGAPSIEDLREQPKKVAHLVSIYSKMRKNIFAHDEYLEAGNIPSFSGFTIVFLCIDDSSVKKEIIETLEAEGVQYIDVGMGVEIVDDSLIGIVRTTTDMSRRGNPISERGRISFRNAGDDGAYDTNVQIAELNALNAALAVIKWKKIVGFYHDASGEHNTLYTINDNLLHNDDRSS